MTRRAEPVQRRHWSSAIVILVAVAVVASLVAALTAGRGSDVPTAGSVAVPNIVGMTVDRASATLDKQGLELGEYVTIQTTALPEGTVTAQSPTPGTLVATDSVVTPTVSTRRDLVVVPDVVGKTAAEAVVAITAVGLRVEATTEVIDPRYRSGPWSRPVRRPGGRSPRGRASSCGSRRPHRRLRRARRPRGDVRAGSGHAGAAGGRCYPRRPNRTPGRIAGSPPRRPQGVPPHVTLATPGARRARGGTTGSVPDRLAVLETKLVAPYPRRGIVVRHGLLGRLDTIDEPMVALLAPAGYGKSTLLAQWAERTRRPVAWLSADERDNDPATLVRGVAAALDRAIGLDAAVIDGVATPGPSVWSVAIPRLGAAMATAAPFTLCVDDVDRIGDQEALDVLITLAGHLGPGSRLGVAGRGTGDFPIARLVSRGQIASVGREAMALDLGETHAVIGAAGVTMTTDEVAVLYDRTEGWPAGVYLSALAARGRQDASDPLAMPMGSSDRLIEDYLRMEVLAATAADDVDLLLRASVFDRISGPLCDEVLGRSGSGVALDRLERANLFLIPLDQGRTWFRFHHLLADLLRSELARREPGAATELRRRAAVWHEQQDLLEPALEYAMAAEDVSMATRLVMRLGQATLNAGRSTTLSRWFAWLEAHGAGQANPRVAALAAVMFALGGDDASSERWRDMATASGPDAADVAAVAVPIVVYMHAFLDRDGIVRMQEDADFAAATMPVDDPYHLAAIALQAVARGLAGDHVRADAGFSDVVAQWERGSMAHYAAVVSLVFLAEHAIDRGDWATAAGHARRARSVTVAQGLDEQAIAAAVDAIGARIAVHRGATEQARADAIHARRLRAQLTTAIPWLALRVRLDLIHVDLGLGDAGGARTLLTEVREILARRPDMGTLVDETAELEQRVAAMRGGVAGASTLTLAELRLLPLLTTHLSFREIGERLFVSQNTVKTQAISIYRKLDATSRSEAVARATEMGFIGGHAGERESSGD